MKNPLFVLAFVLVFLLAACGGDEATPTPEPATVLPEEAQPTEETLQEAPTEAPSTTDPGAPDGSPTPMDAPTTTPSVESVVDGMEHTADPNLVDITWEWERRDSSSGETMITVPESSAYTIVFNSDGTFNATLDCNSSSGTYATPSPGSIFMEQGATTTVECGPESLADQMANMFGPAQDYSFEENDQVLVFAWVAGGPVDYFRNADAEPGDKAPGEDEINAIPRDAIQLDLQGLADFYAWEVREGNPIPPGPGGLGFPPHILLTFDGEAPDEVLANNGRRMYIFPTEAYIGLYEGAGSSTVAEQVLRLEQLIATAEGRQEIPDSPMPLLPPPNSFMDRWAQFLDLSFEVGSGVRYVSEAPNRQDIGPWTNSGTFYYYQGLTTDGTFYVSLVWPASTESLPGAPADVPDEVMAVSTNPETYPVYLQETKDTLNALSSSDWTPDLARLDAMAASLSFPTQADSEQTEEETATATPEPEGGEPMGTITAADGVFIRTGPGLEYPPIGAAAFDETGELTGRSTDGLWWKAAFPGKPEGWVAADFVEASNTDDVPVVEAPPLSANLVGTNWHWVSTSDPVGVTTVNDPTRYTVLFNADGTASIKADCNNVGATYTADGSGINITLGPTTLAACPPDSLDQQFLGSLENVTIYFFQGADLFMDMIADGGTMRFTPPGSAAAVGLPPETPVATPQISEGSTVGSATGVLFQLVSFGPAGSELTVIPDTQITATFTDAEVTGSAGCNDYTGAVTPVDDYFTIGPIATTQQACSEPGGIMEQEQAYLTALAGTSGFQWETTVVNETTIVTAGRLLYTLADGTSGNINYIAQ